VSRRPDPLWDLSHLPVRLFTVLTNPVVSRYEPIHHSISYRTYTDRESDKVTHVLNNPNNHNNHVALWRRVCGRGSYSLVRVTVGPSVSGSDRSEEEAAATVISSASDHIPSDPFSPACVWVVSRPSRLPAGPVGPG